MNPAELDISRNLVAALFRLELSDSPDVLKELLAILATWLSSDEQAPLRRSIELWIARLKKREFPGLVITGVEHLLEGGEMGERFQRQYATWEDFLKAQGRAEGQEKGELLALRSTLMRLLERRFGEVTANVRAMLIVTLRKFVGEPSRSILERIRGTSNGRTPRLAESCFQSA